MPRFEGTLGGLTVVVHTPVGVARVLLPLVPIPSFTPARRDGLGVCARVLLGVFGRIGGR